MNVDLDHYKREFFQETREIIESTADSILKLETDPHNQELINGVFRGVHTIKGSAGAFDLDEISAFTHHLEGLLNALRDNRISLTSDMADAILAGVDHVGRMVDARESVTVLEGDAELEKRFRSFYDLPDVAGDVLQEIPVAAATSSDKVTALQLNLGEIDSRLPAEIVEAAGEAAARGLTVCRIELLYTSELLENGYDPVVFLKNLRRNCELYYPLTDLQALPPLADFEPLALYLTPVIYVASELSLAELQDLCFDESLLDIVNLAQPAGLGLDMQEAMQEFISGSLEMLESAEQAAITWEREGGSQALNEIFRVAHNIKGDADFVGLKDLTVFAHAFESLLENLRQKRLTRSAAIVDRVLKSLDYIQTCIRALRQGQPLPSLPPLYDDLPQPATVVATSASEFLPEAASDLREVYAEQLQQYCRIFNAVLPPGPVSAAKYQSVGRALNGLHKAARVAGHETMQTLSQTALAAFSGATPYDANEPLQQSLREIVAYIRGLDTGPKRIGEILVSDGKVSPADLDAALARQKPLGQLLMEDGKLNAADLNDALKKQELIETTQQARPEDGPETVRTMRVDERKIEQFSNTVGEMLIARNTYAYLIDQLEHARGDSVETVKALKENLHLFSRLSNDIHHGVISLRMIPVRGIFQKFTRVVRDISRRQKKMIEFLTAGEDIEIDKKVADVLSDPMIHLIRNACDHGIEPPLERKKANKPEKGNLLLRAAREGSHIVIRIIDDGRGINRTRLFEKAQASGMAVNSEDDPALLNAIFLPGLSTAAEITDVSGRGVGMDVVKTTIESLGGNVRVTSEQGQGTEITLSIPTALGIDTVLFVEVSGHFYAIPINYVRETLRLPASRLRRAGNSILFHYRGEVLPAHYLADLLEGNQAARRHSPDAEVPVVIIQTTRGKRGLIIDRLGKNMEIAVKPPPGLLAELDIIAGVSIMGDGRVLLVLNPERME